MENSSKQKKALVIGINYTGTRYALNGCINDAIRNKEVLISKFGYKEEDIIFLTDETELKPTARNIANALNHLRKSLKPGDNVTVAYSGHGAYIRDHSGDEKDFRDETIVPLDLMLITDDYLRENFVDKLPAGVSLMGIFDSCHSGTVLDLAHTLKSIRFLGNGGKPNKKIPETKCNAVCISGCLDKEYSYDTVKDQKATGAMSWALHKVLEEKKYFVSYGELLFKMRKLLKQHGYPQTAQITYGNKLHATWKFEM